MQKRENLVEITGNELQKESKTGGAKNLADNGMTVADYERFCFCDSKLDRNAMQMGYLTHTSIFISAVLCLNLIQLFFSFF